MKNPNDKAETNIDAIIKILGKEVQRYDVPIVDLIRIQTDDPYRILVATILSARTKDETTAAASARLFEKAPDLKRLERLSASQIEKLIFPVGFYKNKAMFLKQLPKAITEQFGGRIPQDIDGLVMLPGVGRKTANLVSSLAFSNSGICVDTHVHRITNRLGYVNTMTPLQTEMELRKKLPKRYWSTINKILVAFGQHLCRPVSPYCSRCPVSKHCRRIGVKASR